MTDEDLAVEARKELSLRSARWHIDYLHDLEGAEQLCLALLDVDPDCHDAVVTLERVYRANRNAEPLAEVLHQRAQIEDDVPTKVALLTEVAQLCEDELNDAVGAAATWRQVLDLEPEHALALERLTDLYQQARRFDSLLDVLFRRADIEPDEQQRVAFLRRAGEILADRMRD